MNRQEPICNWEMWMANQVVNSIVLDFSLIFFLHDEDEECSIKIETAFKISNVNGSKYLNPLNPLEMANILPILGAGLVFAKISEGGNLTLEFNSGDSLSVEPDEQYEAWQVSDRSSKVAIICLPGGGLG